MDQVYGLDLSDVQELCSASFCGALWICLHYFKLNENYNCCLSSKVA